MFDNTFVMYPCRLGNKSIVVELEEDVVAYANLIVRWFDHFATGRSVCATVSPLPNTFRGSLNAMN